MCVKLFIKARRNDRQNRTRRDVLSCERKEQHGETEGTEEVEKTSENYESS